MRNVIGYKVDFYYKWTKEDIQIEIGTDIPLVSPSPSQQMVYLLY